MPTVQTARLRLRPFVLQDCVPLHGMLGVEGVLRYYPTTDAPDLGRVERLVTRQIEHWEQHGYGWWAVDALPGGQLIGWSGLQYLPETDEIEIGYLLAKPYWGKGLATEGALEGMHFGFKVLQIPTIVGIVHPENAASQRVLEKIGLNFKGEADYFGMHCYKYTAENPGKLSSARV
ncbi:MAG: GNAT family N-acetyltransferase [Anaerolineales bacterium]